jgi:putative iron-regulated protein
MRTRIFKIAFISFAFIALSACQDDDNQNTPIQIVTKADVISNYSDLVYQSYLDSYNLTLDLKGKITTFIAAPSESGFDEVKTAWLAAREPYGQTEAYRECSGPVDTDNSSSTPWGLGNEGQMNAWPIDESYIDYVQVGTEPYANNYASIISTIGTPITESLIANANEGIDDKSISAGWHAIEFLLWGQDNTVPADNLPGQRLYTDYSTAEFATRRGEYLLVTTDLLLSDLQKLVNTWNAGGTYRTVFESLDENTALQQLINGAFFIAGDELSSERIIAPVDSTSGIDNSGQEDEHSCFSDNTNRDVFANAKGVNNVIFGEYGSVSGASFFDLVVQEDAVQAQKLLEAARNAMAKVNVIGDNPMPFDFLITQESSEDNPAGPVMQSVQALKELADEISASASTIGINLQ